MAAEKKSDKGKKKKKKKASPVTHVNIIAAEKKNCGNLAAWMFGFGCGIGGAFLLAWAGSKGPGRLPGDIPSGTPIERDKLIQ